MALAARIPPHAAALVVDNLELVARYTARPAGTSRTIAVATTMPARRFVIELSTDAVAFTPTDIDTNVDVDLALPAEAFARLVYGRLDPEHRPPVDGDATALQDLRRVFVGP